MNDRVVVCGGGLAGMAAAAEAALLGAKVTLIERRPFLGGRAFSYRDEFGIDIDNGQHVFLGCCTAYRAFIRLIGAEHNVVLQPGLSVEVRLRDGEVGRLEAARFPAPLHLLPSFSRYPFLSKREKSGIVRTLLALRAMSENGRRSLDDMSFGDWLREHDQGPQAIDRFWDLIILPTCNDRSDRVSAAIGAFVYREGILKNRTGSAIGWSRVGLSALVDGPFRAFLARHGGEVRTGHGIVRVEPDEVTLTDGEVVPADGVILALPPDRAIAVAPDAVRDPHLGTSPIVNVHAWFDRPVMSEPFAAIVDSPAQWIFNRSGMDLAAPASSGHHHVVASISGAHAEVGRSKDDLISMVVDELRTALPDARDAELIRAICIKEPDATFGVAPGQAAKRPGPVSDVAGITLAGTWTDTEWPATMESAVRSGLMAARHAIGVRR